MNWVKNKMKKKRDAGQWFNAMNECIHDDATISRNATFYKEILARLNGGDEWKDINT